jgi:hypothetical protein
LPHRLAASSQGEDDGRALLTLAALRCACFRRQDTVPMAASRSHRGTAAGWPDKTPPDHASHSRGLLAACHCAAILLLRPVCCAGPAAPAQVAAAALATPAPSASAWKRCSPRQGACRQQAREGPHAAGALINHGGHAPPRAEHTHC